MAQLYQDSMIFVQHFGKRSLFITITANLNEKEVQDELLPSQSANDHLNMVCQVYHPKRNTLLKDIKDKNVFICC
jgi:hypothetical protein